MRTQRLTSSKSEMVRIAKATACLVLVCAFLAAATPPTIGNTDSARYLKDIQVLAAPDMEGRGPGTKGIEKASKYIERRYKSLGLQPAGTDGYVQPFTVTTGAKLKSGNELIAINGASRQSLKVNQDFEPISFSDSGSFTGPMVFVGYGTTAEEFQYDDYAGVDVKDKIVLVLRYEPETFAAKSGNQGLTHHASLITKAINARNHGAKAMIVANGKLADGEEDLLMRFGGVSGPENSGIMLAQVKNSVADGWMKGAGKSLAAVQQQINSSGKPNSFVLPDSFRLALKIDIEATHARVNNVLAYLTGQNQ